MVSPIYFRCYYDFCSVCGCVIWDDNGLCDRCKEVKI